MNEINVYIGGQIRKYRKANGMTLQQLADIIHKSRATVCKYENGEISIDIATLYEISQALQISFGQLASYQPHLFAAVEDFGAAHVFFNRKAAHVGNDLFPVNF